MALKQMPDVLCPSCTQRGGLEISHTFQARPSAGESFDQLRFSVAEVPRLTCRLCLWDITGRWDGPNHAIFPDPHA